LFLSLVYVVLAIPLLTKILR